MERAKRIYEAFEDWISGLLIVTGLGLMLVGVIMRYFVGKPLSNILEVAVYVIIWGILIGAVVAIRDNAHIRVDMLYQFLPEQWQRIVGIFANLVGLAFALFILYYGIVGIFISPHGSYKTNFTSLGVGIELWKVYLILPIMGLMMAFRFILRIVRILRGLPESDIDLSERPDLQ